MSDNLRLYVGMLYMKHEALKRQVHMDEYRKTYTLLLHSFNWKIIKKLENLFLWKFGYSYIQNYLLQVAVFLCGLWETAIWKVDLSKMDCKSLQPENQQMQSGIMINERKNGYFIGSSCDSQIFPLLYLITYTDRQKHACNTLTQR
jgi:hypothetical protein